MCRVDAAPSVEAEQWIGWIGRTVVQTTGQQLADAGAVRNKAALAELPASNGDELTVGVDITDLQVAGLTGA